MMALCANFLAHGQGIRVAFRVDLREELPFAPDLSGVGLRGDAPPLSWTGTLGLEDADGDGRYEGMVVFPGLAPDDSIAFRFVYGAGVEELGHQPYRKVRAGDAAARGVDAVWNRDRPFPVRAFEVPLEEVRRRRARVIELQADGLTIYRSRSTVKTYEQHAFLQQPEFYYFTGLHNAMGAILLIDGPRREATLFVAPSNELDLWWTAARGAAIEPSTATARQVGVDRIIDWRAFPAYVDQRLRFDPTLKLYVDPEEGVPPGPASLGIAGDPWHEAIARRWPDARLEPAVAARRLRLVKSAWEIDALRAAGWASARAFLAGVKAIRPGVHARIVEAEVVRECMQEGGNGVYFWPVVHQGARAVFPWIFGIDTDYRNMGEALRDGALVRLDIGCDVGHYMGDVGRTIPVSGTYSPGQREAYNLLVAGYRAGLASIRAGISVADVADSARAEIRRHGPRLATALGRAVHDNVMAGRHHFLVHEQGVGGDPGDIEILEDGMVVAWEPMVAAGEEAFYLEDMLVVRPDGYELLTPGLPYTAEEIEAVVRPAR
jgi:Xaa-Pro aminopeptidase